MMQRKATNVTFDRFAWLQVVTCDGIPVANFDLDKKADIKGQQFKHYAPLFFLR